MSMRVNKKQKSEPRRTLSIGGISILMVFVMLCLTTFGLLTLATARAEMRLTEKNAQSVTAYYESSARMQEILAKVDGVLIAGRERGGQRSEMIRELTLIDGISVQDDGEEAILEASVSSDSGPIGMYMRLFIDEEGNLSVDEYHMKSFVDFDYDEMRQEIWSGN